MAEGLTVMVTMIDAIHDSYYAFCVRYLETFWPTRHNFYFLSLVLSSLFLDLSSLYHFIDTLSLSFFFHIGSHFSYYRIPRSEFSHRSYIWHLLDNMTQSNLPWLILVCLSTSRLVWIVSIYLLFLRQSHRSILFYCRGSRVRIWLYIFLK